MAQTINTNNLTNTASM